MEKDDLNFHQASSFEDDDLFTDFNDEPIDTSSPKSVNMERLLHLIHLLFANECSQQDIFERLKDYYRIDNSNDKSVRTSTRNAYRMLNRDMHFLEKVGYEIQKQRHANNTIQYILAKGSAPITPFFFNRSELDTLALLHTLFADPTKYTQADASYPLPLQAPRTPFADEILVLIERLTARLPQEEKKYFDRRVKKPYIYFNLHSATDYLPHRDIIETIVDAILKRRQIRFDYASMRLQQGTTPHEKVDPYYIIYQDGHLYLFGFSHDPYNAWRNRFFEWRIDRIKADSIKLQNDTIDATRRRHPIEFRYWIDASIARGGGLSQRWLSQTIEREEVVGEGRQQKHRLLVRAQDYDEWRIIQQLHKYGDKVELIDPPALRDKMRQEVERMYNLYHQ